MTFETEKTEFKSCITEDIYKEIIAFANTTGGTLYIGVDNDGNEIGLTDADKDYTRITNGVRDAIQPDITMCLHYEISNNKVVVITVNEGTNKPYYLKGKGIKPNGVFVRQGTSAVPASNEQIRRMIKESDGDSFEELRSSEQELSFNAVQKAFRQYGVDFGAEKYRVLGITQKNSDIYTNLAWIISDQCPYTTKIAVFSDETCTVFRDSREFTGSVFTQLEDIITYLALCNKTSSVIHGIVRIDRRDYPEEALREALLNALVHRDYSFSGSIIININETKTEIISLGGLLNGLTVEDIRIGISQPRNKNLAEMFHRLRLIESYGTGIRRIFKLYEDCPAQPVIEITSNAFKITLPNMNEAVSLQPAEQHLSEQMRLIMNHIAQKGTATEEELEELLGVKHTRMYNLTREMIKMNILQTEGRGKNKKYYLK